MKQDVLLYWFFLFLLHWKQTTPQEVSEEPISSSWLDGDWSAENVAPEVVFHEPASGCICRFKQDVHVVCYGGRKCKYFPKSFMVPENCTDFHVKTAAFQIIEKDDLVNYQGLQSLEIDGNNQLQFIAPGVFHGMMNLKKLSISYNSELKVLHNDTFYGLKNLEQLRLVKNGFSKLLDASQALQTKYLPKLTSLSLNENSFPSIYENSFDALNGTSVVELELVLCQIGRMHAKSFNVFTNLQKLRIGDNLLQEEDLSSLFEEFVDQGIPIKVLNLYNSGFRKHQDLTDLLMIISHLNVSHLILARNHIENISSDIFPFMPNLKYLDLREVSAVTLEVGALRKELMPGLQVLMLGGNKLAGILPGVQLPQLTALDLSNNSGGSKFPSYFDVISNCLSEMTDLKQLDLSYNHISTLSNKTFSNMSKLQILGLKNATIFYIAHRTFANMSSLEVLNLESNPFQPFNKLNGSIFDGLVSLKRLLLAECKISHIHNVNIFKDLHNLNYLDLRSNELASLEPKLFLPLTSLIGIDLSDNLLKPWTNESLFTNNNHLAILKMAGNRLTCLSTAMLPDLIRLNRLDMSKNIFVCDCWTMNETISWMNDRNVRANETFLNSPGNTCSAPELWRDKSIADFIEDTGKLCLNKRTYGISTSVYIFLGVILVLSVSLGAVSYIYRWHLRYWAFLVRISFLRRHSWLLKKNQVHPGDYKYDVFVSYSHEDRNFIVRLVSMLENQDPFLKLCVYERDFEIGTVISDTVMEKVRMSQRTLLVVSNAFAKSQWCMWELQLAEYHRLFFRKATRDNIRDDPLIIVKLGPIAESNMTPTLKFLLKSRIYLEWNSDPKKQTVFWERLRSTLHTQTKIKETSKEERSPAVCDSKVVSPGLVKCKT